MTQKKSSMEALLDDKSAVPPINQKPEPLILKEEEAEIDIPEVPLATPKPIPVPTQGLKKKANYEKLYSSLGISRKFLPPITRKRAAIYELVIQKGAQDRRLEGVDKFVDPQPYQLVPNYTFNDFEDPDLTKREKTLTYYEGGTEVVYSLDPVTGRKVANSVPKVGAPEFIGGQVVVPIRDKYPQYVWWELHPRNASNKWRDKSKDPIFKRVDIEYKSPHIQNIRMDLAREAEEYVISLKHDQRLDLAAGLANPTINLNLSPQELLLELRTRGRANPEEILYTRHDKNNGSLKVAAIHALDLGILSYVPEAEAYYVADDAEPSFPVPIDNNPFDSLIKFLASNEGQSTYKRVQDALEFWF